MIIEEFIAAMSNASPRPIGVKVCTELWKLLASENLIIMRDVVAPSLAPTIIFKAPFYEDTFLIYTPELDCTKFHFELPPNTSNQ